MMMSSVAGQRRGPSDKSAAVSEQLIAQITAAVEAGNKNLLRKLGMGSFGILYGAQEKKAMELFDPEDVHNITSLWSSFKKTFTSSRDHGNLFFHLYGVMFFMVPHVHGGEGSVKISLCSSNDPTNPVLQEKVLYFSGGAQAVLMSPTITLPFVKRGPMFYYTMECLGTRAQIPCSVVAIWKQKIDIRSAIYSKQETMSWAIEALHRPQFFQDRQEAAQYISSVYSNATSSATDSVLPFVGAQLGDTKMNVPSEARMIRSSSLRVPMLKVQSKRFSSMEIPSTSTAHLLGTTRDETVIQEESRHEEEGDDGVLFPVKKAQGLNYSHVWDNLGIESFVDVELPENWDELSVRQQVAAAMIAFANKGVCLVPKHIINRDKHNIHLENITEHNYLVILERYGIVNAGSLARTENWYNLTLAQRVEELIYQRDDAYFMFGDNTNPYPPFDCYDGLTLKVRSELERVAKEQARQRFYKEAAKAQVKNKVAQTSVEEIPSTSFATKVAMESGSVDSMKIAIQAEAANEAVRPNEVMFEFGQEMNNEGVTELELQQPACVASNSFFNVGVFEFAWKKSSSVAAEVLSLALPAALFGKSKEMSMGSQMLKYYDAALIMYKVILYISGMGAISGQLALVWDECNVLNRKKEFINIASLYASKHRLVSASEQSSGEFCFTPTGIGKFVPLDPASGAYDLGSIRVFVTHPLASATELESIPCHIHLQCKVLSTNIMQPPRLRAQAQFGMKPDQTHFPRFPTNQVLLHYNWGVAASMGTTLVSIFSPSGIYESDGTLQPSLLGNIARNCKWWTGTCVFEICIEKTQFHSGSLAIGLGTLNTSMSTPHDILNMPHVICNLEMGRKFYFRCTITNWNGKNLLTTGRKSSLPRPKHMSHMRLFATVLKPLVSTSIHLDTVGVTVQLKCIEDLVLGGTVSVKPIYGHWTKGKNAVDFLFSEMDLSLRKEIEKLRKENVETFDEKGKKQPQVQVPLRDKFSYGAVQYFVMNWKDEERLLVLPCAPWSVRFPQGALVQEAITCPFIDWCSSFCYWSGSLEYTIIVHRVQTSNNIGGVLNITLDSSGYPFPLGISKGAYVVSAGGGAKWAFTYGVSDNIFSFVVHDDEFFPRRHTKARAVDPNASRIMTLQDRLGNLIINLPAKDVISSLEILVKPGPDFKLQLAQAPSANHEKHLGDMQTHTYLYTPDFSELRSFEN
uniref:Polyprotein n=1 Tax=Tomato torrado virus TaxID=370833 RepID=C3RXU6_9SECO|nr:polyprotein [Tomato torrado virus]